MISDMYINPALVSMVLAMLAAFVLVGGLIWKAAKQLTSMETTMEGLDRRLTSVEQTLKAKAS